MLGKEVTQCMGVINTGTYNDTIATLRAELADVASARSKAEGLVLEQRDEIAGLRETLVACAKLIKAEWLIDNCPTNESPRMEYDAAVAALSRTPDQHRKSIEAGVLREMNTKIDRERDSYLMAFGSFVAQDVQKMIQAEADRLERGE